jgi:opacity protein-like surface antigen
MKIKNHSHLVGILLICLITLVLTGAISNAQEWNRNGKSEIYLLGQNFNKASTSSSGLTLEFDKTSAFGLGYGSNINDRLNINTGLFIGSADLAGKMGKLKVKGDTSIFSGYMNMDINILNTRLTPLITGGIGYIRFDGNFSNTAVFSVFSEIDFSYNMGVGFRWDVSNHFLIKAIYRNTWTNMKDTDKAILFKGPELSIGYIF